MCDQDHALLVRHPDPLLLLLRARMSARKRLDSMYAKSLERRDRPLLLSERQRHPLFVYSRSFHRVLRPMMLFFEVPSAVDFDM